MKLSFLRKVTEKNCELRFQLPSGKTIPIHAHITEAAVNSKEFTDCGGVRRLDKYVTLQLWVSTDIDHRLNSDKFKKIISTINVENDDLEVFFEYEEQTTGRYSCDEVVIYSTSSYSYPLLHIHFCISTSAYHQVHIHK